MSQALYRKYRSRGFEEVVGQRHVTDLLASAVKNGTISHAYLFTGPHGTGKTSVARILAHRINDLPYADDSTHLDIIEIDAASNRRIDDIRDLREKVYVTPTSAKYKVYIIDEVHMLTSESFNALLKTLEEPPAHAIFILATTELHKVPATIISRTQRFHFRPGSVSDVTAHLRRIADIEKIDITDDALRLIAEHSDGGFRDSVSLLDQVSSLDQGTITVETIEQLLGLAPHASITTIVDAIAAGHIIDATRQLHRLFDDGISPHVIVAQLTKIMSAQAVTKPQLYTTLYELIEVPRSYAPHLKVLAIIGRQPHGGSEKAIEHSEPSIAETHTHQQDTPHREPVKPVPSEKPPANATSQPPSQHAKTRPETNVQPSAKPTADVAQGAIDWDTVLSELHKHSPALHSIVKRADVTIDDAAIRMKFAFALHRKKLQDDKNRAELVRAVTALYGSCPEIIVDTGAATLDATSKAVADIMGGGEVVRLPEEGSK